MLNSLAGLRIDVEDFSTSMILSGSRKVERFKKRRVTERILKKEKQPIKAKPAVMKRWLITQTVFFITLQEQKQQQKNGN